MLCNPVIETTHSALRRIIPGCALLGNTLNHFNRNYLF